MSNKKVSESATTMTQLVLPNDTNTMGNLRGGKLLHWMDVAAAICAQKHADSIVVTAAVDSVSFENPIGLGEVVTMKARITRAFRTSMEIFIEVWADSFPAKTRTKSNEAYYTFVAIDSNGKPQPVPEVITETKDESDLYDGALRRRELRLVLGGRLKPNEANELRDLFK